MDESYRREASGLPRPKFQGPLRQTRNKQSWYNDTWEADLMFGKMTIKENHDGELLCGFEPAEPKQPVKLVVDHRKRDEVG